MSYSFKEYSDKTVLVTGATGFTGRVLTEKLIKAGAKVNAIARHSSQLGDLAKHNITWFRGDVFDPDVVASATAGVQYIFHLAAAFREEKPTDEVYRPIHVESTKLLAKSVVGKEDFECFVHVSTVGVHGHIEVERGDEEYRFAPGDGYQRTKLEAELWLREFGDENNLPYSVVRPTPIFGSGDMRLLKLYRMISKGYLLMIGKGAGIYHLIHVDDASNIILLAGITAAARSQVMIAANDDPISIENMAKTIAEKINVKKLRTIRLPLFPFYLASDICKVICTPLGIEPPIYRRRVDFYTKDRRFDNSKVKRLLNYEFNYNNEQGIKETANWYLDNGFLPRL